MSHSVTGGDNDTGGANFAAVVTMSPIINCDNVTLVVTMTPLVTMSPR